MKKHIQTAVLLALAVSIYAYLCDRLDFTQDDAYISYRYVENYLRGDGLVYNIGERIEGYTNFGWVIYLIFWGALGMGYIAASKITGFLLGAGVIVVTAVISRMIFTKENLPFAWLVVLLVSINQSLAYWSPAGLETAAFAFAAITSLYLYLIRNRLLTLALVMAVMTRPEGALVAFIIMVIETIERKSLPLFSLRCTLVALIFSLPLAVFKLLYYGSILPNPFYAKTGISLEQLSDGLTYAGRFFGHYGFYGLGLVVPLIFWKSAPRLIRGLWIFMFVYLLYIILVGGDVLKVHRFFVPVIGINAILIAASVWLVTKRLAIRTRYLVLFVCAIPLLYASYTLPREFVLKYNQLERQFTRKMSFMAENLMAADSSNFSVALPTIGIFGYQLMGHQIIDMVGLTDSTIARHPEPPIEGMASTWRERRHASRYLLGLEPDYIVFSTDMKPSAPAEKALLMYRQFLESYRMIGWDDRTEMNLPVPIIRLIYKRVRELRGDLQPEYPLEFVEYYKLGLESYMAGDQRRAIELYRQAIDVSPEPPYIYLLYNIAFSHLMMNEQTRAVQLLDSVVARDSLVFLAHAVLYKHAVITGRPDKAARHWHWLKITVPWLLPQLKAETDALVRDYGRRHP